MVIKAIDFAISSRPGRVPNVVVVDPHFEAYGDLVASSREGRIGLHLRASGAEAMRLARRLDVDAWIVAPDLDDMAGGDFVELLGPLRGEARVALVRSDRRSADELGVDTVLGEPISCADLEVLLGLPVAERGRRLAARGFTSGSWAALPVSIGAAAVAIAVLMIG